MKTPTTPAVSRRTGATSKTAAEPADALHIISQSVNLARIVRRQKHINEIYKIYYDLSCESSKHMLPYRIDDLVNIKTCSLSRVLTATDQKPQKIIKKVILPTITWPGCQRVAV